MNHGTLMRRPVLCADESLAADRLLEELLAELTGETVHALDARRPVTDERVAAAS